MQQEWNNTKLNLHSWVRASIIRFIEGLAPQQIVWEGDRWIESIEMIGRVRS